MSVEKKRERVKDPKQELDELWSNDEWKKWDKLLCRVPLKGNKNALLDSTPIEYLKTNTILDELFGGGIRRGQLVELYGNFGSGKTQICDTLLVESKGFVVFVDSEGTFSQSRIKQIAQARGKDVEDINKRLLLYQPTDWKEQVAVFHQLPNVAEIELIIVDSLMAFFRSEKDFIGRGNLQPRQGLIRCHLAELKRIAKRYKATVIITNQISQIPDAKPFTPMYMLEVGVGGPSVHHVPDTIIYLRRAKDPKRIARLMDSSEVASGEVAFIINERGIDDIPEEEVNEPIPEGVPVPKNESEVE